MATTTNREQLLYPKIFHEIKQAYTEGGTLFINSNPVVAVNDYQGYKFTDFLEYYKLLQGVLAKSVAFKSFPKVFYDAYLARFSVSGTVPFQEIKSIVDTLQGAVAVSTIDMDDAQNIQNDLGDIVRAAINTIQTDPDKYNTVDYLLGSVFSQLNTYLEGSSNKEFSSIVKERIVELQQAIQNKRDKKTTKGILVDDRKYEATLGRGEEFKQSDAKYSILENQEPIKILYILNEKIYNDILLPFSDLNAEIKILSAMKSLRAYAEKGALDSKKKRQLKQFELLAKIHNISNRGLVESTYRMFTSFLPLVGIDSSKEKFLLLNRFFSNAKGDKLNSPVIKQVLMPVQYGQSLVLVKQTMVATKDVVKKAGESFEQKFKNSLVASFGGAPKPLVIRDSSGFETKTAIVNPNDILLTSEIDDERARKNAHANIHIPTSDGKDLYISLKSETFGYLSGTNMERGKKRLQHTEVAATPLGKKWFSDISQFNSDIGAIFAASLPVVLAKTEEKREAVINEFSNLVFKKYGATISNLITDLTVESLQMFAKDLITSGQGTETNKIIQRLIGRIKTIRENQSIGAQASISDLSILLVKPEFRLWRMLYEQTLETKCLFGEERDDLKAGLGFENVSHMIVAMPVFSDNGGEVVISPDPNNSEQFVVANKNFKMITPVRYKEAAQNSDVAVVKYEEFFKRVLPVMISRKQGGATAKSVLNIQGLGSEIVPIKALDLQKSILNSGEVNSAFAQIVVAGQEQDKNKYIAGLQELSNLLNSKFADNSDSSLIRFERGQAADKDVLISKINDTYAASYKINLAISLALRDSRVDLGQIQILLNSKNQQIIKEMLIKVLGFVNDDSFDLLEAIVMPKDEPPVQEPVSTESLNQDVRNVLDKVTARLEEILKQKFMALGDGIAKKELNNLSDSGLKKQKFSYNIRVAIDKTALLRYLVTAVS